MTTPETRQAPSSAPLAHPSHQAFPTTPATPTATQLQFGFDGGAATWLGVGIAGTLITVLTLGICYPWAVVMTYRWKSKHTYVNGQRLRFTGSSVGLFGMWIKWLLLTVITIGIYSFWVYPRLQKWIIEHQEIDPTFARR